MSRPESFAPPVADLAALGRKGLVAGLAGLAASGAGFALAPDRFFRSWLIGWVFVFGIALGAYGILLVSTLSRGAWGLVARRTLGAAAETIPLFALFALPVLLGATSLYPWADAARVARDEVLHHQSHYLNPAFFAARLVLYFVIWAGGAVLLTRLSARQDAASDPAGIERTMQVVAGPALVLHILAVTFFAVDVLMSLNPRWFSTIYGLYLLGGQAVSGMAFLIVVALFLSAREPMSRVLSAAHVHDWGKLLLAFMMLWSYFAFSQFIIIWSGDLPEEIGFYRDRFTGGWGAVALGLVLFHFAVPFLLLLSRDLKRDVKKLSVVAVLLLAMRWVDLWWLAIPAFSPKQLSFHWLDLATPLGMGGLFLFAFTRRLAARPLLPAQDPNLEAALRAEAHHG
ncbi:MAG TPA: hypothetical protein PK598_16905 [Thermoanaerobaculia bacterium]|nr:hypothetical protein [Thermoanaerobaculia bacterium]